MRGPRRIGREYEFGDGLVSPVSRRRDKCHNQICDLGNTNTLKLLVFIKNSGVVIKLDS